MAHERASRRERADPPTDDEPVLLEISGSRAGAEITLRKLKAFWAIAHSDSLTRAAKALGIAQPSLSQQLTSLEAALGAKLFERRSNRMELTEAGAYVLRKSEHVLRSVQELEEGLSLSGRRTVALAGVNSAMRVIVPATIARLEASHPELEYDLQESAPTEILEMLYARRINVGLMSARSVAEVSAGFLQVPILQDPYVLAVPARLDLAQVSDPERDLDPGDAGLLNNTIQFVFGTQHARRIEDWYDRHLPSNRLRARVRSFETAIDLVRAGLGICIAPALSVLTDAAYRDAIRLYAIDIEPRQLVAMIPAQYRRIEIYAELLGALQAVAAEVALPPIHPMPPFVAARQEAEIPVGLAPTPGDRLG